MRTLLRVGRPSTGTILGMLALFVALSSSAHATHLGNFLLGRDNATGTEATGVTGARAGGVLYGANASTSGGAWGVNGRINSTSPGANSAGVRAINNGTNGNGFGVWGSHAGAGAGILATSARGNGLRAQNASATNGAMRAQNTGGGPALDLLVNSGVSPFKVNSSAKVANLNADELDGLDSGAFTQGTASRTLYARRSVADGSGFVTLLDLGWVKLVGACYGNAAQFSFVSTDAGPFDLARDGWYDEDTDDHGFDVGVGGDLQTVQVGQTYRVTDVGPPRTRMATFLVSGRAGAPCPMQAQVLAQGY